MHKKLKCLSLVSEQLNDTVNFIIWGTLGRRQFYICVCV